MSKTSKETFQVLTIGDAQGNTICKSLAINTSQGWDWFKEVLFRATNTWPDAPPEVKELADLVCEGSILQDYHSQDTSKK